MTVLSGKAPAIAIGAVVAATSLLYGRIFADLVRNLPNNADYSHAWLLGVAIVYLVWVRRERLRRLPRQPSNHGLWIVLAALALLLVGTAGVEFFLMRISAIGTIAGIIVFLAGWSWLRTLLFPLSLMLLVIPIPPVLFYQATFPLQLLASKFGVAVLSVLGIPVFREGNVITLTHTVLEVTEACSGIRSLMSLFSLAVLYAHFAHDDLITRLVVVTSSVPIAIFSNGLRVAGTGIAAHQFGPAAATGFFHAFSGWVVFVTAMLMLILLSNSVKAVRSSVVPRLVVAQ
jgi:exosortase